MSLAVTGTFTATPMLGLMRANPNPSACWKRKARLDIHLSRSLKMGVAGQSPCIGWSVKPFMVQSRHHKVLSATLTDREPSIGQTISPGAATRKTRQIKDATGERLWANSTDKPSFRKKVSVSFGLPCLLGYGTRWMPPRSLGSIHQPFVASPPVSADGKTSANSLHGEDAWDRNPWVTALTFTVHRQNIDQINQGDMK